MHHEYFWGRQCAFVFPIYVRKYRKYTIDRWIVVYTVCASAVISPLRQWLDSYAKSRLKMWYTFKHFIHMQYFLLPTNLVIVFVHWVSTGVLYEPRQCSLFWDYIPESKLCFCPNLCHPPGAYAIRPILHSQALAHSRAPLFTQPCPHCSHSRAPIVHTAVHRENNEHGCVYLRCRAVCKLPGCVEGHPWIQKLLNCQQRDDARWVLQAFIPMGSNQKQRCGSDFAK